MKRLNSTSPPEDEMDMSFGSNTSSVQIFDIFLLAKVGVILLGLFRGDSPTAFKQLFKCCTTSTSSVLLSSSIKG